jgi:hypothetical protein
MGIKVGEVQQAASEQIVYQVDFSNWGTPTSPTCSLVDLNNTDLSATCLQGVPVLNGSVVTTPLVKSIDLKEYWLHTTVTITGNIMTASLLIKGF